MTGTRSRASRSARVWVDYFSYWIAAGPDIEVGEEIVPGLLTSLGPQAVSVTAGRQMGHVTVRAKAITEPPADIDPAWNVVAETDLECPEGIISVLDWGGPDHEELGDLAIAGAGRYRVRVHVKGRDQVPGKRSAERYYLIFWPARESAPTTLLTPMDNFGLEFSGVLAPESPPLNAVEQAAARAVREVAYLLQSLTEHPDAIELSGEVTKVRAHTVAPGSARRVWNLVSAPWDWFGLGGNTNPAGFDLFLFRDPEMSAAGRIILTEPVSELAFTWSWATSRWVQSESTVEVEEPRSRELPTIYNAMTGEITSEFSSDIADGDFVRSWMLPAQPSTVHIKLTRQAKDLTLVEIEHQDLPVELTSYAKPFWDWALSELHRVLTKAPFYGFPWDR